MSNSPADEPESSGPKTFTGLCALTGACTSAEKLLAEEGIEQLYDLCGQDPPAIIWCRSPYQLLTLPSLIFAILHSDLWHLVYGDLAGQTDPGDKEWQQQWNELWSEIWLNSAAPILAGINATSRVGREYGYLEGAMISDLKLALARNLRNSRWQYAQENLKREMYRKFWYSPRQNNIQDRLSESCVEMSTAVLEELDHLADLKNEIAEEMEQTKGRGESIDELLEVLGQRLGSEPHLQLFAAIGLSDQFYWMATALYILQTTFDSSLNQVAERLAPWLALGCAASAILTLPGAVFICERPMTCHMNERLQLHNTDGPALTYTDGFAHYAWNGIIVPEKIIKEKDSITVEQIERETNVEVRRVMLEIYGEQRFLDDSGIVPIQEDETGILYRKEFPNDEALVMVKVVNRSPEPDGTFKHYYLRVPPHIETAQEAVAWTFEFEEPEEYGPEIET
jgi:hypothetical protein